MTSSSKPGRWRPKVCTSVYASDSTTLAKRLNDAVEAGSDFVEIRLDYLKEFNVNDLENACSRFLSRCIFTCRPLQEGGVFQGGEKERLATLSEAASLSPRFVDLELAAAANNSKLVKELKSRVTEVIVSWHNSQDTPAPSILTKTMRSAEKHSDTVKIVTTANSLEDNFIILSSYEKSRGSLIAFCMGEKGVVSRVLCPFYGSPFAYASLQAMKTAPGQVALNDLKALYRGMKKI
ncbi:MAG: type I 3-dehydroquinate dehydratase [Thaumarchaeota archaeon]|nr:type I 3-dehydroquinate dehydratase [Nitrososphaerota archaeon]